MHHPLKSVIKINIVPITINRFIRLIFGRNILISPVSKYEVLNMKNPRKNRAALFTVTYHFIKLDI